MRGADRKAGRDMSERTRQTARRPMISDFIAPGGNIMPLLAIIVLALLLAFGGLFLT
jgi:hypothetical protein